jgi:putative NADPH-quinone reductase
MNELRRILVINGHPDPAEVHFCHALTSDYLAGAAEGGHEHRRLDLAQVEVPYLRSRREWESTPPPATLARAADLVAWADHLVFIFPLWLGTMPALVKAFLEHILRPLPGSALGPELIPRERLEGKSARVIVPMGRAGGWYCVLAKPPGVSELEQGILRACGASPVEFTLIASVEHDPAGRERARATVRELGKRGR